MRFIYPAVFRQTDEGHYEGHFPDLECCYAKGETLDDAVEAANEAANDWISLELSEEDGQLPSVTDPHEIPLQEGEVVRMISVNIRFTDGWDE